MPVRYLQPLGRNYEVRGAKLQAGVGDGGKLGHRRALSNARLPQLLGAVLRLAPPARAHLARILRALWKDLATRTQNLRRIVEHN